jgi:putative alpha-1,2-mannosidase
VDGRPFARPWIPLAGLRGRHTLAFDLAASPQPWGAASAPPSYSPR